MDYRDILSECFRERRRNNPRYSWRAFARDIALSPSRLSEVLSRKGDLSRQKGELIASNLGLSPLARSNFLDMIDAATAPSQAERQAAADRVSKREVPTTRYLLDEERFELIADPRYLLIWSFMFLPVFDGTVDSLSQYLRMNPLEIIDALQRLERANLVVHRGMTWQTCQAEFSFGDSVPSEALRAYHRKISMAGRKAIDSQTMSERCLDSIVIPFKSSRLGEVKQRISGFTQDLIRDFGEPGDSVYGLSLQFFRMAHTKNPNIKGDVL